MPSHLGTRRAKHLILLHVVAKSILWYKGHLPLWDQLRCSIDDIAPWATPRRQIQRPCHKVHELLVGLVLST